METLKIVTPTFKIFIQIPQGRKVLSLTREHVVELLANGHLFLDDTGGTEKPKPEVSAVHEARDSAPFKKVKKTKGAHWPRGRTLNGKSNLPRWAIEDIVYSKGEVLRLTKKYGISSATVQRFRVRIVGTRAEKDKQIRAITDTPTQEVKSKKFTDQKPADRGQKPLGPYKSKAKKAARLVGASRLNGRLRMSADALTDIVFTNRKVPAEIMAEKYNISNKSVNRFRIRLKTKEAIAKVAVPASDMPTLSRDQVAKAVDSAVH